MSIDGFDFTTIANGRIDPDSPLSTDLFTDMRDNMEFLKLWLGKSFVGAAVADHNHDGANSKKVNFSDLESSGQLLTKYTEAGKAVSRTDTTDTTSTNTSNHAIILPTSSEDYFIFGTFRVKVKRTAAGGTLNIAEGRVDVNGVQVGKIFIDSVNLLNEWEVGGGTFCGIIQDGQNVGATNNFSISNPAFATVTTDFDILAYQLLT